MNVVVRLLLLASIGCAASVGDQGGQVPLELQVGVVTAGTDGELCFRTRNGTLVPGHPITLVRVSGPQRAVLTEVAARHHESCPGDADSDDRQVAYRLELPGSLPGDREPMIGVIGSHSLLPSSHGHPGVDLDGDGIVEEFYTCTSQEGVHLSIWNRGGPTGTLRWHGYVYLGYDVEPDCPPEATRNP